MLFMVLEIISNIMYYFYAEKFNKRSNTSEKGLVHTLVLWISKGSILF